MRVSLVLLRIGTVFVTSAIASIPCIGQSTGDGCRGLSEQIWYDAMPPLHAHSAGIVEIQSQAGHTSIFAIFSGIGSQRTDDYGENWRPLNDKASKLRANLWGKAAPSDPHILYQYESNGVITRSEDGGKTWIKPSPKIDGKSIAEIASEMSGENDYVIEFDVSAVHPLKPLTIYATAIVGPRRKPSADFREQYALKGTYVSEDGGANWTQFSAEVGIFDTHPPYGAVLGITPLNPDIIFGQGEHGIVRSVDGGKTWKPVGQSDLLNLEPLDTEDRDEGKVPRQVRLFATEYVFDPSSPAVVYLISRKGVHRSLDGGDNWTLLNLGFDRLKAVRNMAIDPLQPNRLFVGTDRGLFMSVDRGCTFEEMNAPER